MESTVVFDDENAVQSMLIKETKSSVPASPAIIEEPTDQHLTDDWSEVRSGISSFTLIDDCCHGDGDEWSILSEVASVKSFSSGPISYSDALRFGRKVTLKNIDTKIPEGRQSDGTSCSVGSSIWSYYFWTRKFDDELDNAEHAVGHDAVFVRNGIKECRGGRAELRFKGKNRKVRRRS